jgi:hypothetical protein
VPANRTLLRGLMRYLWIALWGLVAVTGPLGAQDQKTARRASVDTPPVRPPFPIGEALDYRVHVSVGGNVGTGQMRVEGPVVDRGVVTWKLSFDMDARRGPIRATDRTTSWLDPVRFATTRFEKTERHPLSRSEEKVEIDAAAGTWSDGTHDNLTLGSTAPLDELSFLYFLRTLPLDREATFEISRHFDPERNPTTVHIRGEELVETPAGIFRTRVVEMHVKDPKRYKGVGVIRLNLDIADCHVPVKIESRMPLLGPTTLTLVGWAHPPRYPGAMVCED